MSLTFFFMVFFYWLFLTGSVFLAGSFIIKQLVTAPSGADVCMIKDRGRCFGEISLSVIFTISLLTFIVNAIHLYFHAAVMTDTPLKETSSILFIFLTKTKYGRLGLLRTAFLLPLILIIFSCMRTPRRWKALTGTILSISLLISLSMSGHQAVKGYTKLPFYLDVIHIVSISIWIGGIFFIRFCYSFFIRHEGKEYWRIFQKMITGFSNIATWTVYTAGATGLALAFVRIKGFSILTNTAYGTVFIIKVLMVTFIFLLGGINKFFILPALFSGPSIHSSRALKAKRLLYRFVTLEAFTGLFVMLATAFLTHLSPTG